MLAYEAKYHSWIHSEPEPPLPQVWNFLGMKCDLRNATVPSLTFQRTSIPVLLGPAPTKWRAVCFLSYRKSLNYADATVIETASDFYISDTAGAV